MAGQTRLSGTGRHDNQHNQLFPALDRYGHTHTHTHDERASKREKRQREIGTRDRSSPHLNWKWYIVGRVGAVVFPSHNPPQCAWASHLPSGWIPPLFLLFSTRIDWAHSLCCSYTTTTADGPSYLFVWPDNGYFHTLKTCITWTHTCHSRIITHNSAVPCVSSAGMTLVWWRTEICLFPSLYFLSWPFLVCGTNFTITALIRSDCLGLYFMIILLDMQFLFGSFQWRNCITIT